MITTQKPSILQTIVAENAIDMLSQIDAMIADPSKGPFYVIGALQQSLSSMLREFAGVQVGN